MIDNWRASRYAEIKMEVSTVRIFLTGEKQIGKSTVLRRTVELLGAVPGGFYTRYWETEAGRSLRLCTPWAQDSTVQDEVACWENGRPVPRVEPV